MLLHCGPLLFSVIERYDMSMLWLDAIPIWLCERDLARALTVFIAALFDCIVESDLKFDQSDNKYLECFFQLIFFSIWYEVSVWLPRPQAAAAAIRAILAWVSSLTSVHSSQHCWCNWPLENINHMLQMVEKKKESRFCRIPYSECWHQLSPTACSQWCSLQDSETDLCYHQAT